MSGLWKTYFRHKTLLDSMLEVRDFQFLNVHLMIIANHIPLRTSVIWLIQIANAGKVLFEAVSSFWTHQRGHTSSDFHSPGQKLHRAGFLRLVLAGPLGISSSCANALKVGLLLLDLVTASFL